jgi:hypothetical protein
MGSVFYCIRCKNYIDSGNCLAFPDGIPLEILRGEDVHEEPLPEQDNDIVFEPIEE